MSLNKPRHPLWASYFDLLLLLMLLELLLPVLLCLAMIWLEILS